MAASWECPSLPMIHLPMKDSAKVTFLAVKPMIAAHYEEDPESFHDEIKQLDQLRELALRPSRDYNGCSVLRRYFAQLHLLRARFPPETIGHLPIDFAWKDVYTNTEYIQEGLQIEQASVLYNICCLHSQLASRGRRDTEQEMKEAIAHFQCAAGAYAYLDERFATSHASKDLGPEFVAFYKNLMLGQAQECFVEKSLKGVGRVKNNTVAKLAARVSEYYSQCLRPLEVEPCNIIAKKNKDWPKLLKMKALYFQAISHFYQGAHTEEIGRHGEAVAWYQFSLQKLSAVGRVPKSLGEAARDAVKNFSGHVQEKLQTVKRQNDQVYHDPIPDIELLEPIQGADLVKPMAFHATDPKNLGTDIFSRLVPMGAYEAASVFSEEKAKLLRSIVSSVSEKDEELEHFLVSLNAGEIDKLKQDAPKIPDNVLEQHEQMQGKSMLVKKLHSDLQSLMELSTKVTGDLDDINEKKKEEVEGEEKFQAKFGSRTPSQVCAALWKDSNNYQTYHNQASKSNVDLKSMFDQHYQFLLLLSGPLASLQATVPKMTPMDAPEEDGGDSERWEELMTKIEKMRQQRRMLIGQLREQINSGDITKTLIGHLGSDKDVFIDEHMKRHRDLADIIRQNLAAQDNILLAVTDVNARQVRVRQAAQDLSLQQERLFAALVKAGTFFSVLQSKISEGLSFYTRLHDNVSKLHKRVLEVVATRSREREAVQRQRSPSPGPGPAPPRPPKKAELTGKPLPHDQQVLPPDQTESTPTVPTQQNQSLVAGRQPTPPPVTIAMTSVPPQPSSASLEEQLIELQRTQQLQLEQLSSPTSEKMATPTSETMSTPSSEQQVVTLSGPQPPASVAPPPAGGHESSQADLLTPDANQALLDLQLLLQPPGEDMAGLSEPIQPQRMEQIDGQEELTVLHQVAVQPTPPEGQQVAPQLGAMLGQQQPPSLISEQPVPVQPSSLPPPSSSLPPPSSSLPPPSSSLPPPLMLQTQGIVPPPQANVPLTPPADGAQPLQGDGSSQVTGAMGLRQDGGGQPHPLPPGIMEDIVERPPNVQGEGGHIPYQPMAVFDGTVMGGGQPPLEGEQHQFNVKYQHIVGGQLGNNMPPQSSDQLPVLPSPPPVGGSVNGDSTITTNSISRPIPAPVQSPPPITSVPTPPAHVPHPPPPMVPTPTSPPPVTSVEIPPPSTAPFGLNQEGTLPPSVGVPDGQLQPSALHPPHEHQPVHPPSLSSPLASSNLGPSEQPASALQPNPVLPTTLYQLQGATPPPASVATPLEGSSVHVEGQPESHFDQRLASHDQSLAPPPADRPHPLPTELTLSHGIDTSLRGIPEASMMSHIPPLSSVSSFALPLSTSHTHSHDEEKVKMELLLQQQKDTIERKSKELEEGRAQVADQKRQLDTCKQQVAVLHQQLSQLTTQQQKQEQEKVTVSGQQAVLMQLLQQQQGMFSQQQTQLESLSKVNEDHHKQLQESEMKYRQALAVEQEQKSNLQNQVLQLNQEIQRLHHQLQNQAQQQQTAQMQVYQYHTQIQERDKQLIAFRDQHKEIVQKLEQKHQEKVTQLVQQIQEMQIALKKSREQQRALQEMTGLPLPQSRIGPQMQQTPRQQQPLPQQQQPLPQQQQPLPQQQQPLPQQQQPLPQQQQMLPQQPRPSQPQMSQISSTSVPGTPTSVQHRQGILQPSPSAQPMSQQRPPPQQHSAQQPHPPTSVAWPPTSVGVARQGSQTFSGPGQSPLPHPLQQPQLSHPSTGMVAPSNRPMMQPGTVPQAQPSGQTLTGGQGPFPPSTGVVGYPPQFMPGQQQQIQRPPQAQYPNFPQYPGQMSNQQPRQ